MFLCDFFEHALLLKIKWKNQNHFGKQQWRIYVVKFWKPPPGPNSFNLTQFFGKFGKIICSRHPEFWRHYLGENPGSATEQFSQ